MLCNYRDFTPRIIRQTIEKDFSLEDGALDAPEYKQAIKTATKAALVRMRHLMQYSIRRVLTPILPFFG